MAFRLAETTEKELRTSFILVIKHKKLLPSQEKKLNSSEAVDMFNTEMSKLLDSALTRRLMVSFDDEKIRLTNMRKEITACIKTFITKTWGQTRTYGSSPFLPQLPEPGHLEWPRRSFNLRRSSQLLRLALFMHNIRSFISNAFNLRRTDFFTLGNDKPHFLSEMVEIHKVRNERLFDWKDIWNKIIDNIITDFKQNYATPEANV